MSGQYGKETNNDNYWMQVLGCHYTGTNLNHQGIFFQTFGNINDRVGSACCLDSSKQKAEPARS